jgi:hypothetical protein
MPQLSKGTTFQDTVLPGAEVNAARLNALADLATLLNGAVIDQTERTTPNPADTVLVGDSTQPNTSPPLKVQVQNLLIQAQRDGTQRWGGVAGGTMNAITVTTNPASTGAYVAGEVIRFQTGGTTNTGAVTIAIDSRGAKNLYSSAVAPLIAGDLPANSLVEAVFDGTQFQIVGIGAVNSHLCGESLRADAQQYATAVGNNSLSIAPVDSAGAPTYTAFYDGMVVRFKVAAANTTAVTLQVGALAAKSLVDNAGAALNAGALNAGQIVTAVYDLANNRYLMTSPICGWEYVSTAAATLASGITTFTHGLAATPTRVRVVLVCSTAQSPFAQNDELDAANVNYTGGDPEVNWWANSTTINVCLFNNGQLYAASASGVRTNLTATSWKLKVYASL